MSVYILDDYGAYNTISFNGEIAKISLNVVGQHLPPKIMIDAKEIEVDREDDTVYITIIYNNLTASQSAEEVIKDWCNNKNKGISHHGYGNKELYRTTN